MKFKKLIAIIISAALLVTSIPMDAVYAKESKSVQMSEEDYATRKIAKIAEKEKRINGSNDNSVNGAKKAPAAGAAGQIIGNEYLEFAMNSQNKGRFTMGTVEGNPNYKTDNNKLLTFGHPTNSTSFTTIRINETDYVFKAGSTTVDAAKLKSVSTMVVDQVLITQTLEIIKNETTGNKDTVKISYTAKNQGTSHKTIGVRVMMDTMLGSNDGAPFKVPSIGEVTTERELIGQQVPSSWQAFDSLSDPETYAIGTLYQAGDVRPDKVQFASWWNIDDTKWQYNTAGRSITGDSAVATYWYPKSVPAKGSINVNTYYGVGVMSDVADSKVTIGSTEYGVEVKSKSGTPISGAKVTIDGMGTAVSNANGLAVFKISSEDKKNIEVAAEGYQTKAIRQRVMGGGVSILTMNADDGKPYIKSITLDDDVCLLSDVKYFEAGGPDTSSSKIVVKGERNGVASLRYRLIQNNAIIDENNTGVFDIVISKKFKQGSPIYAYVTGEHFTSGVESSKYEMGIYMEKSPDGSSGSSGGFTIGKKTTFPIPNDWPLIGGAKLEFGFGAMPLQIDVKDNYIKVAIGQQLKTGASKKEQDDFWSKVQNSYTNAMKKPAGSSFLGQTIENGFAAGKIGAKVEVVGYGEGKRTGDLTRVSVGLCLKVTTSGGYTQYFAIGPVPVYVDLKIALEVGFQNTITATFDKDQVIPSHIAFNNIEISMKPSFTPSAGIGINDILSVEVGGSLAMPLKWGVDSKYFEARANGSLYAEATALVFNVRLEKQLFDILLFQSTGDVVNSRQKAGSASSVLNQPKNDMLRSEAYAMMNREYLSKTEIPSNVRKSSSKSGPLRSNVYPQSQPKMVTAGNKKYMFWLDDAAFYRIDRTDANRTILMYSVCEDGYWSVPKPVDDDGTADFYFDAEANGDDVFVSWTNCKKAFGDEITLNDMTAATEIKAAGVSSYSVKDVKVISSSSFSSMQPSLSVDNTGNVLATWTEREGSDLFVAGTNRIITSSKVGEAWSSPAAIISEDKKQILFTDAGMIDEQFAVSYVLDNDGDLQTQDDRNVYVYRDSNKDHTALMSEDAAVSNPQFGKIGGKDALLWYNNNNISYIDSAKGTAANVFSEPQSNLAADFSVLSNSNQTSIVWGVHTSIDDHDGTDIYSSKYLNGTWSNGMKIGSAAAGISKISGVINDNGRLDIAYASKSPNTEVYQLHQVEIMPEYDTALVDIQYDPNIVKSGASLPMELKVSNQSAEQVEKVNVAVETAAGSIYNKTVSVVIPAGETKAISLNDFILPELNGVEQLKVKAFTENEAKLADNETTIDLGYTDLNVSVEKRITSDGDYALVNISNLTEIPAGGTLRVFADDKNGAVLHEEKLEPIVKGTNQVLSFDLSRLTQGTNIESVTFLMTPDKEEFYDLNNSGLVVYQKNIPSCEVLGVTAPKAATIGYDYISARVSQNTASTDIKMDVSEGAEWKLYADAQLTKEIADKKVALAKGENLFYVQVTSERTNQSKLWTLSILRENLQHKIQVTAKTGGTVKGAGVYGRNGKVTLKATAKTGYAFAGWYEEGLKVSSAASYSFTVLSNRVIEAHFKKLLQVAVPKTLRLTTSKATWKNAANNNGYILKLQRNGRTIRTVQIAKNRTSYTIPKSLLRAGYKYAFAITAKGAGAYYNSKEVKSVQVIIRKALTSPSGLKLTSSKATWRKVYNNNGYTLRIMRGRKTIRIVQIRRNATSYRLPRNLLKKGSRYNFTLVAKGTGVYKNSRMVRSRTIRR